VDALLELVATQELPSPLEVDEQLLSDALVMATSLAGKRREGFRRALLEGLLRVIEMHVLADDDLMHLSQYWDSYLGRERDIIAQRVQALLGTTPPTRLIEHIRSCLEVQAWKVRDRRSVSVEFQSLLFRRVADLHPRRELRCELCGYHFREEDLGEARRLLVADAELRLAASLDPRRKEDPLKPTVTVGDRAISLTQLTIDHVVPVAGYGWTEIDNLRVICQFCNGGKFSYRRPLEPLAPAVAASLMGFPLNRAHTPLRQVVVASAIAAAGRRCIQCGRTIHDVELTVRLRPAADQHRFWFVPWNVDSKCYDCG
jgi:5-methylcytosine-specific restriction endonuclease McrA